MGASAWSPWTLRGADADAGGFAFSLAKGQQSGSTTAVSIGVAVADNSITNTVQAYVDNATVTSAGNIDLVATSNSTARAVSVSGALSATAGQGNGVAVAAVGAGSGNTIKNTVQAYIKDVAPENTVTTNGSGHISLSATDTSLIHADAGGVAIAVSIGKSNGNNLWTQKSVGLAVQAAF